MSFQYVKVPCFEDYCIFLKALNFLLILFLRLMSFPLLPLLADEELSTNHNNY